jgi:hypothetical protein
VAIKTIDQLTAATAVAQGDLIAIKQGGITKKASLSLLVDLIGGLPGFTDVIGTTRTLVAGDDGARLRFTNPAGCTVTVPNDLPEDWTVFLYEGPSGGTVSVVFASGAAVQSSAAQSGSLTSTGDGDSAALECVGNATGTAARFSVTGFGPAASGGTPVGAALTVNNGSDYPDPVAFRNNLRISSPQALLASAPAVTWNAAHPEDGGHGRVPLLLLGHAVILSASNLVAGDAMRLTVRQPPSGTTTHTLVLDGLTCAWYDGYQPARTGANATTVYEVAVVDAVAMFNRWGLGFEST